MSLKRLQVITAVENIFADDLKRLREFTKDCRQDMHEPDEQGISAEFGPSVVVKDGYILHPNLDNACTGVGQDMGFWLINEEGKREWFNLADIIALARR
jgi:hypothetical protein